MKCKIILTAPMGVDSKAEIAEEILVVQDILGQKLNVGGSDSQGDKYCIFEGEFHEFYLKVKERIMRKFKAYE